MNRSPRESPDRAPFRSPWQRPAFVRGVAILRRVLRPFGGAETRLIRFLVARQNRLVHRHLQDNPPTSALLILPRCLKKTGCRVDVQSSVAECLACRQCPVGDAAAACHDRGLEALVAFRSHIAFAMARERQPDVIVATACDDRLVKALRSVPEHPALLAPLTGMERMCINATLDLPWLHVQLDRIAPTAAAPAARKPDDPVVGAAAES